MNDFIAIPAFAERIGVPTATIYAWAEQKIIPTTRHGGRIWVNIHDIPEIERRYAIYQSFKIKRGAA